MVNSLKKGKRGEYLARKLLIDAGYTVIWTAEDPMAPDLLVNGEGWEVKYGLKIPKVFYKWLDDKDADVLLVKRVGRGESHPWLIIRKFEKII